MYPYNFDHFRKNEQKHTHEYLGSDDVIDNHSHRVAGVTGGSITLPNGNHYHNIETNTTYNHDHFHVISGKTGLAITISENRHVHLIEGETSIQDKHKHHYQLTTLL
jgi:hypothetical protein